MTSPSITSPRSTGTAGLEMAGLLTSLRQQILSGEYPVGTWLPAERELADSFGVTRRAVRRVVELLAEEGLVVCRPRFRPVVAASAQLSSATFHAPGGVEAIAASRLVALVMWHGDPDEQGATAQQRIFWGMNRQLAHEGFHGVFLDLGNRVRSEPENAEREAMHLRYASEQKFAGIIFYPYAHRRNRELIQEVAANMPIVLIDRMIPNIRADYVGVDNHHAMYEETRHVISMGHRRILYVTTGESINTVQDRLGGYRQALSEAPGGALPENILTALSDWNVPEWPVFDALFRLRPEQRPTAIICVNDLIAVHVTRQLARIGLHVPTDVALCGFDDNCPVLPGNVGLTTIAQPFEEIGSNAAEVFLTRYKNPAASPASFRHIELPARLVVRASTSASTNGIAAKETHLVHEPKRDLVVA